jgi:PEP-CTERM motif
MKAGGKLVVTLALALLVFPIVAMADNSNSYSWINSGAVVSAKDGFSLSSAITAAVSPNASWMSGNDLGTLQLTTGNLLTGSLQQGCLGAEACSFSFVGSSFTITGANGGPSFSGKLGSNILLSGNCVKGTCSYSITGVTGGGVTLVTPKDQPVGTTVLSFTTKGMFTGGKVTAVAGTGLTNVMVPEPGTLGLFGVGLFGLAVILKRKLVRT